ncbi:MAG: hypothetical protein KGQ52_14520 [Alphaproteobacteria bacterium]|nr:hypothetical protein [Alphaproteobacteria bacterium]
MGIPQGATDDAANIVQNTVLSTAAGAGSVTPWLEMEGTFNFSISGSGVGSVILERSFDGGVTAIPATNLGAVVTFTGPASETMFSRERGVLWRARRTVATSGNFSTRFSQ